MALIGNDRFNWWHVLSPLVFTLVPLIFLFRYCPTPTDFIRAIYAGLAIVCSIIANLTWEILVDMYGLWPSQQDSQGFDPEDVFYRPLPVAVALAMVWLIYV